MKTSAAVMFFYLSSLFSANAYGFAFAQGYSSASLGDPAKIYYRAFTLHNLEPACSKTAPVSNLVVSHPKTRFTVGDRIYRNDPNSLKETEMVIEAFDETGNFVPSVPIDVQLIARDVTGAYNSTVFHGYSDMNYTEAVMPGEFDIIVSWACSQHKNADSVTGKLKLLIEE